MLRIDQLSYWERDTYFTSIDFLIIGSGIVGSSSALHLKQKYPAAKILVLEKGYLPSGASTKNAGFACFGSPTELLDDLSQQSEHTVWETVRKRWEGLQKLKALIGSKQLDLQVHGSWDLIKSNESKIAQSTRQELDYLNQQLKGIVGQDAVFSEDSLVSERFGFNGIQTAFYNRLEGQVNTGKMMHRFHQLLSEQGILLLNGIEVEAIENNSVQTPIGTISANQIIVTVNGFAQQLLKEEAIEPARAQVLITSPIKDLKIKGTFHYQQGYYYFRNIHNRILLGGGRNLDKVTETTYDLKTTSHIQNALTTLLKDVILPHQNVHVEYAWSGIMGIGPSKHPIVKRINQHTVCGVRLGGMGVALGSNVGKEISDLL